MENSLFNDKKKMFRAVIILDQNWKTACDSSGLKDRTFEEMNVFEDTLAGKIIIALENELYDYIQSLNFNDVKMLKIVIEIGKDQYNNKSLSPNVIYKNRLDRFNKKGWASKEVEIHEVTKTFNFAENLKSGLDILKVSI